MAVTISASDLADAAQLRDGTEAARLLAVATALVEDAAPGAPEAIQNEAAIRVAGWLAHTAPGSIRKVDTGPKSTEYAVSHTGGLRYSGALALLAPWVVHRAGAV